MAGSSAKEAGIADEEEVIAKNIALWLLCRGGQEDNGLWTQQQTAPIPLQSDRQHRKVSGDYRYRHVPIADGKPVRDHGDADDRVRAREHSHAAELGDEQY